MIFISHSNRDSAIAKQLHDHLIGLGLDIWIDHRELSAGQQLADEIKQAIDQACYMLAIISPNTVNSKWVKKEIKYALARQDFKVIPLLLKGISVEALDTWFADEPAAILLNDHSHALLEALPQILAAIGQEVPHLAEKFTLVTEQPLEELILELEEPEIKSTGDKRQQFTAKAKLIYEPADKSQGQSRSRKFQFIAPLGPIEQYDIRWYLEQYYIWPAGEFKKRAETIANNLPIWGQALYQAALGDESAVKLAKIWRQATGQRRFSVYIDDQALDEQHQSAGRQAAGALWAMPWELLHDGTGYLAQGGQGGRVRRRLPRHEAHPSYQLALPIKILLVSPRPKNEGYIDHRISAKPLVRALQKLGELAELTILNTPTLAALQDILSTEHFHVLHFDGHGVYDRQMGLGALCFEQPANVGQRGEPERVYADKLTAILREYRIPLVFLEACQSAQSDNNAQQSVAAALLQAGIVSVIAMTHSVMVNTAEVFVRHFYPALAQGQRIGEAMLAGQRALMHDQQRFQQRQDDFFIEDWFVPVLYQERDDPALFKQLLPERLTKLLDKKQQLALGELPAAPSHRFIGRSQQLLALERSLLSAPYAVITGQGGAGKTALAVELARWLLETGRVAKVAFVCLEHLAETKAVLDSIGRQLLPRFSVAEHGMDKAFQKVAGALAQAKTLILLDNCESLMPDKDGLAPLAAIDLAEFLSFCSALQQAGARLLFTSREALPEPFARHQALGALSEAEAIQLLKNVLVEQHLPLPADVGAEQQGLSGFVQALNCHARSLLLVAPMAARQGLKATADNLANIMDALHHAYPDQREKSLYASLELSLQRLSTQHRLWLNALAVFHGGFDEGVLVLVLDIDLDDARKLAGALVEVGLAEAKAYGYYSLDPALSPYLTARLNDDWPWQTRWLAAMQSWVYYLVKEKFKDAQLAATCTLLDLANLLALIRLLLEQGDAERTAKVAGCIEALLADLQQPQALAYAVNSRRQAAGQLKAWGPQQFENQYLDIERLLQQSELQTALDQARQLLSQAQAAGAGAYQGAAYNLALAYFMLGRILSRGGLAEAALAPLHQAQQAFQALVDTGYQAAAGMVSVTLSEQGDCLRALGQLDKAAATYRQAIQLSEQLADKRGIAVKKVQLATVLMLQQAYQAALSAYQAAKDSFLQLNEPGTVAIVWHQIGMVYRRMQAYEAAEQAYRESLAIESRLGNTAGIAASLAELGSLYDDWGKLEQAVVFKRQALDSCRQLGDQMREGRHRYNIAISLIRLQRYDEARRELLMAIDCDKAFGHSAEPWTTWALLHNLEQACQAPEAAKAAKQQAIQHYLAYRRDGGQNLVSPELPKLCQRVVQAGHDRNSEPLQQELQALHVSEDRPAYLKPLLPKLIAILQGQRSPTLADDPDLDYDDAAELLLLLEQLG